ncbi:hypothetical protein AMATHDRAFT_194445 [Amanita thiersii Skay4041]|uniref:FAD-binding PCMH-type domain-containing protein n=1 Tax=Amanita thiersii Skay4041 TaxID=703135 RepID=A0A2A9NPV6_9AGAR|nr:hypothetical protein AMATHDRAFT_194445 [Amanita thiersii Skay4041]
MRFTALTTTLLLGSAVSSVSGGLITRQDAERKAAAQSACKKLKSKLGTTVVQFEDSPEWDATLVAPWNLSNDNVAPTCIVFPYDHTHVSAAMQEIFKNGANYAVQAGGHTAMKGWNVAKDGVLIMFSHMKNVTYNPQTDSITLQPGVRWEQAILATEPYGVAPLGGRVSDVGTGLLLGGGISYLSPQYGFASDMFRELDVVLPNGDFVTATVDNEYSDLFWALKGCANRCGIVTRYEVYAAPTGTRQEKTFYGGTIKYPASSSSAVVNAMGEFNSQEDPKAIIISLFNHDTSPDGTPDEYTMTYIFYHGSELPDSIFGQLLSIPSIEKDIGPRSYYEVITSIPKGAQESVQFFGGSANYRNSAELQATHTNWRNFTKTFYPNIFQSYVAYTPLLTPMINAGRQRGGNPIDAPTGGFITINFGLILPENVPAISDEMQAGRMLLLEQSPPSPGLPIYIGEIDVTQNAYATYGQYDRLKQVHAKYDPTR